VACLSGEDTPFMHTKTAAKTRAAKAPASGFLAQLAECEETGAGGCQ
jgi:hypothetical protein